MGIVTMMSSLGGSVSAIIFWVMDSYNALDDPFKDYDQIQYQVTFIIPRLKFPTTSRISIITSWINGNFVFSIILYWRHAKFATGRTG